MGKAHEVALDMTQWRWALTHLLTLAGKVGGTRTGPFITSIFLSPSLVLGGDTVSQSSWLHCKALLGLQL